MTDFNNLPLQRLLTRVSKLHANERLEISLSKLQHGVGKHLVEVVAVINGTPVVVSGYTTTLPESPHD